MKRDQKTETRAADPSEGSKVTTEGLLLGLVSPPSVPPFWSVVRENTPLPPRCTHGPTALLPTLLVTLEALRPAVGRVVVEDDTLRLIVLPARPPPSSSVHFSTSHQGACMRRPFTQQVPPRCVLRTFGRRGGRLSRCLCRHRLAGGGTARGRFEG